MEYPFHRSVIFSFTALFHGARPVEYPFHRSVIFSFTALFHGASREDAKHAKVESEKKIFAILASWRDENQVSDESHLALWNSASGEQLYLGRVGISQGLPREIMP